MSTLEEKIKILRTKSKEISVENDGLTYHFKTQDEEINDVVNVEELKEQLRLLYSLDNIDYITSLNKLMLTSDRVIYFANSDLSTNTNKLTYLKYYYFLNDCLNRHLEAKSYYDLMLDLANINCIKLHKTLDKIGISRQTYYFLKSNPKIKYKTKLTNRIKKGFLAIQKDILTLIKKHAPVEDYQFWSTKSDTILITSLDSLTKEYPFLNELNYIKNK